MRKLLLLPVVALFVSSCSNIEDDEKISITRYSTCGVKNSDFTDYSENGLKSVTFKDKSFFWNQNETIYIWFFNGTKGQQSEFMKCCYDWQQHTNLKFVRATSLAKSSFRVSFEPRNVTSVVYNSDGTTITSSTTGVSHIGPYYRTGVDTCMHIYLGNTFNTDEFRSTVRHELGHALGFLHEHESPNATIKLNGGSYKYPKEIVDASEYDIYSIMHYQFFKEETEDKKSYPNNVDLSAQDIKSVSALYPQDGWKYLFDNSNRIQGCYRTDTKGDRIVLTAPLGKIFTSKRSGTVALKHYFHAGVKDNLYTISDEVKNVPGWECKGTIGYVYNTPGTDRIPVVRYYSSKFNNHKLYSSNCEKTFYYNGKDVDKFESYVREGVVMYLPK